MVEIHKQIGPQAMRQLSARYKIAAISQQQFQDLKGLPLQFDSPPGLAQTPALQVGLEGAEPQLARHTG